jgi:hypothetical protein
MSKYKCADGVDRDVHIDEYLALEVRRKELKETLLNLNVELKLLEDRMSRISIDWLGSIGHAAINKHKKGLNHDHFV